MRYVAIDLETTGLDPRVDQVLMAALIIEDTTDPTRPVEDLPTFAGLVRPRGGRIVGDPYALSLNSWILQALASAKDYGSPLVNVVGKSYDHFPVYHGSTDYVQDFEDTDCGWWEAAAHQFLNRNFDPLEKINVAGKNAAGFDLRFLSQEGSLVKRFRHRVLDPGSVFVDWSKDCLPSLGDLKKQLSLQGPVTHDAVEDARDVIRALRQSYWR